MRIRVIGGGKLDGLDNRGRVLGISCCIISALYLHPVFALHLPSDDKIHICRIVDRNVFPHRGL
jgi:hypothetical protein